MFMRGPWKLTPDPPDGEPPKPTPLREPDELEDEDLQRKLNLLEKTLAYRAIALLDMKFTLEQVMVLVHTPDIVHEAEPLIANGCEPDTAFDILSP
jgi:hypothetical protein